MWEFIKWISQVMDTNLGQGVIGAFGAAEQDRARQEAEAANAGLEDEARDHLAQTYNQGRWAMDQGYSNTQQQLDALRESGMGMLRDQTSGVNTAYGGRVGDIMSRLQSALSGVNAGYGAREGNIMGSFNAGSRGLDEAFRRREGNIMGEFAGLGDQARRDIGQRYGELGARGQQDLTSRGLGGSTMLTGMRQGLQRQQEADQRRLGEDLRRERIGYRTQLSGDTLANRRGLLSEGTALRAGLSGDRLASQTNTANSLANMRAGLTGEQLAAQERGNERLFGGHQGYGASQLGLTGDYWNQRYGHEQDFGRQMQQFLGGIRHTYPDSNWLMQFAQQHGQNAGYSAPKQDNTGAYVGAGAGILTTLLPLLLSNQGAKTPAYGGYPAGGYSSRPMYSDEKAKGGFRKVDSKTVLDRLSKIPVSGWSYKADPSRSDHVGPMAQDFKKAFGLGDSDKHIHAVDAFGVSMSAIQGLNDKIKRLEKMVA